MSYLVSSPFFGHIHLDNRIHVEELFADVRFLNLFPFGVFFTFISLTFHVPISIFDKNRILGRHNQQKIRDKLSCMGVALVCQG